MFENRSQKNRLSKLFWEFDDDHSGSISFTEFSNCSEIGKTKFTKNAFCLLDVNHDGGLSFPEFIVCIWHFCTILPQDLPGLAYECYVREDEPGIHTDTLLKLVDEAMGVLSGTNAHGYDGREREGVVGAGLGSGVVGAGLVGAGLGSGVGAGLGSGVGA